MPRWRETQSESRGGLTYLRWVLVDALLAVLLPLQKERHAAAFQLLVDVSTPAEALSPTGRIVEAVAGLACSSRAP
jgi:hypothetical protein